MLASKSCSSRWPLLASSTIYTPRCVIVTDTDLTHEYSSYTDMSRKPSAAIAVEFEVYLYQFVTAHDLHWRIQIALRCNYCRMCSLSSYRWIGALPFYAEQHLASPQRLARAKQHTVATSVELNPISVAAVLIHGAEPGHFPCHIQRGKHHEACCCCGVKCAVLQEPCGTTELGWIRRCHLWYLPVLISQGQSTGRG